MIIRRWKVFFKSEMLIVQAEYCEINASEIRFFNVHDPTIGEQLIAFFNRSQVSGLCEIINDYVPEEVPREGVF